MRLFSRKVRGRKSILASFIKKNWFGFATIIITFAVLLAAAFYTNGFQSFATAVTDARPGFILAAFLLILLYWLFDALSLYVLTIHEKSFGVFRAFYIAMIGLLYSALTPFAVGGQPMQIYLMSKSGVSAGNSASAITVKSIIYQAGLIIFAIAALFISGPMFHDTIKFFNVFTIFGFVCNMAFVGIIALVCIYEGFTKQAAKLLISLLAKIKLVKDKEKTFSSTCTQIDLFKQSVYAYKNKKRLLALSGLFTIIQFAVLYSVPYMIFRALNLSGISLTDTVSAAALIAMITAFVPLPGSSGAAEGGFFLFFKLYFTSAAAILPVTLIWRFVTYYSVIFVGLTISMAAFWSEKRKTAKALPESS